MISEKNAPRLLGAAFLFVILVSLTSGLLLKAAAGVGSISEMLLSVSKAPTLLRLSVLFELINSSAIVVLASLLYVVLNTQNKIIALVALGWWLAEALALILSSAGAFALVPLSLDFVAAGAPQSSFHQTLGQFLYGGLYTFGYSTVHMWFYCIGGMLWYYLFFKSKYIPRAISLFGLAAVSLAFVGVIFQFFGYDVPILVSLPLLPFELTIGAWLLFKGIKDQQSWKR
jgi:hypothetical protein